MAVQFCSRVVIVAINNLHIGGGIVPCTGGCQGYLGKNLTNGTLVLILQITIERAGNGYDVACPIPSAVVATILVESIVAHACHTVAIGSIGINFRTTVGLPVYGEGGSQIEH